MVDLEDVEATFQPSLVVVAHILPVVALVVAAVVLMEAAFPVVERFARSARLRPAEGTERETAAVAQPLLALIAALKSHHLHQ